MNSVLFVFRGWMLFLQCTSSESNQTTLFFFFYFFLFSFRWSRAAKTLHYYRLFYLGHIEIIILIPSFASFYFHPSSMDEERNDRSEGPPSCCLLNRLYQLSLFHSYKYLPSFIQFNSTHRIKWIYVMLLLNARSLV